MPVCLVLSLLSSFGAPATAEPAITVTPSTTSLPVNAMLELTVSLPTFYANPYDPDPIDLQAVVTTPTGTTEPGPTSWHQPATLTSP